MLRALLAAVAVVACASAMPSALDAAPASLRARLEASGHALAAPRPPAAAAAAPPAYGVRCSPLDFGGDPTGTADSAPALAACVAFCANYSAIIDYLGHFPGDSSFGNGKYIANAGGCTIDLGGGEFKLSSPVRIPEYLGNINFGHGSLVADDSGAFPADSFLLVVGIPGSCRVPQGSCNVAINCAHCERAACAPPATRRRRASRPSRPPDRPAALACARS